MFTQGQKEGSQKTMASLVAIGRLPEGTVDEQWEQLQGAVREALKKVEADAADKLRVSSHYYNWVLGLCVASLYAFSPQGRIHGMSTLLLDQFQEMKEAGHTMCSMFKTNTRFGYQPIIASVESIQALEFYLGYVRPVAIQNGKVESAYLFITFNGCTFEDADLGRHLSAFYTKETGLHITSNNMRKLVETTAYERYRHGLISDAELQAIHDVNGHSSETANNFYKLTDRAMDAHTVRNFLSPPAPNASEDTNVYVSADPGWDLRAEVPVTAATGRVATALLASASASASAASPAPIRSFPRKSNYKHIVFGSNHPEIGRVNPKRVAWSVAELEYIRKWREDNVVTHEDREGMYARCLKDIQADKNAHSIFHPNHVQNSAKLRNGFNDS